MDRTLLLAMPKKVRPASEFGERLTALRKAHGLTQIQLADKIGSTQRAVSRYETIADRAPAPVLAKLAQALGVSTDELLGVKRTRAAASLADDPEARRLWRKFQQVMALPEKDCRAVIRLVNSLVTAKAATKDTRGRRAVG
jgi:transcriptional regulator with XRE-family HTH domain